MQKENVFAKLVTKYGNFRIFVWKGQWGLEPVALVTPTLNVKEPVLVRIHSECLTGDTFGSLQCDCNSQKVKSLEIISKSGNGIFIYLRQEGRGIGLFEKIRAYKLQEEGYDTYEANLMLGHKADEREYSIADKILKELGIAKVKLITNNPEKVKDVERFGIDCLEQIPIVVEQNEYNKKYLETKKTRAKEFTNKNE